MSSTGGQNLVVSQQPSSCKREESQKISCSSQNSEEFSQQEYVNASANTSSSKDDLEISKGSLLGGHYKVEGFLGEGGFSIVTKCRNTKTNEFVAIKVNKKPPEILQQAKKEILILEQLRGLDADRCNIVQWNGFFLDHQRICLNFELLDQCLWDYIEDRKNQGLPISEVRPILHQLTNALSHLGSVGIVHADLKPGNIMVVNRHKCPIKVKLIDFGLACPASKVNPGGCEGTVGYRAPEVVIGSRYNEAIDMWSLGLVAVELTQGQPPDHVLDSGYQSKDTRYIRLKCLDDLEQLLKIRGCWEKIQNVFVSLIKQMLALDPNQRITPSEVLHHPFFNPGLSKSSPCTDMKRTQKISCSSQNSEEFSQQEYVNASANTSSSIDDLKISKGTLLGDHYEVEGFLGEGRFGIVTKCRNTKTNEFVAIKVNKKEPKILQQAEKEILILMLLRGLDADRCNIVQWNNFFIDGDSICLNFELLDQSLWQYMRDRNNQVLPIGAIRLVLFQLANALSHLGSVGIVHADLKPRNIMVVDRYECPIKVKLIDFGFACPASTVIPGDCVGTVGYRAPEVVIGSLFNEAIDMWSLGLVAVELATGFPFYPGRNDYDVLKFIIQTQGQPPDHVLDSGLYTDDYFIKDNYNGQLAQGDKTLWSLSSLQNRKIIENQSPALLQPRTKMTKTQTGIGKSH
uniref:Protein kinase domain-containing protein n=1 Tax=Oreochromis aureus TaxID=47969 RepID=A0AAZ1XF89_OREAU